MKYIFILLTFLLFYNGSSAQYALISNLDWLQGEINPAYAGVNGRQNVILDYNRSWTSGSIFGNQGIIRYDRALVLSSEKNVGGFALSLLNNKVEYKELFNRFQASFSLAHAVRLNKNLYLNFGLMATYFNDRVENTGLLTGSQYVPGWGFNPALGNNESLNVLQMDYYGVSTGLFIYQKSSQAIPDNYLGFSVKNFNRPANSFSDQGAIVIPQINITGGIKLIEGISAKMLGELWYSNTNKKNNLIIGAVYSTINHRKTIKSAGINDFRLLTRYSTNQKWMIGGQLLLDRLVVGATYDVPLGNMSERGFESGFEILVAFSNTVKPFKPNRKKRNSRKAEIEKTDRQAEKSAIVESIPEALERRDITAKSTLLPVELAHLEFIDSLSQVLARTRVGAIMTEGPTLGFIYFEFASNQLSTGSEAALQALISDFFQSDKKKIILTGHTDNIGSKPFNLQLSLQRAEGVRKHLISYGVDEGDVIIMGKGEDEPLVPNSTEEDRSKNRRVEISFY